jgi:hypothetical protein
VLTGSLELASRNITAGSVRIGYSVIYSLFLGFGISIGAELYRTITGLEVIGASNNWTCAATHSNAPWYQVTPSGLWCTSNHALLAGFELMFRDSVCPWLLGCYLYAKPAASVRQGASECHKPSRL